MVLISIIIFIIGKENNFFFNIKKIKSTKEEKRKNDYL